MEISQEVKIEVLAPEQRSQIGGVNKFFVYTVRGKDVNGQINVNRRYSDFFLLRQILIKRWPGIYIPSLPQKKTIGSDDKIFVESRRRGLQYFLIGLSESSKIWNSQEINIFLRNSTTECEKMLSPLMKENFEKMLLRYQQIFPQFSQKNINKEADQKIIEFNSYLMGSKAILEKLSEMTQKMHDLSKRASEKKFMIFDFLLPDYEKACLLENDEKKKSENLLFLCSKNNGISQSVQKFKALNQYPPVLYVSEEIKREKREIQAFQDLIKVRDSYQADMNKQIGKVKDIQIESTKINAGKQSFFTKIKKVSKEEQLQSNQKSLDKARKEEKDYAIICHIITNIISSLEIDRFKQKRQKAYFQLLKKYAKEQKNLSDGQVDIWLQIGRHDWIALEEQNNVLVKKYVEEQKPNSSKSEQNNFRSQQIKKQEVI